jgi:hypothetical protein
MRATEETELAAYQNCVNFIVSEMDEWIRARMETFWEQWKRSTTRAMLAPALEKGIRVDARLAKALHCLQDSFSPGHVLRSDVDGNLVLGTAKKNYNHPHDEEDINAKHQHDDSDYYAGSLAYAAANAASYASADLIMIGLNSIANHRSDATDWTTFTSRWLTHRSLDAAASKMKGSTDIDTLLQRTCSPSKMACGRCSD